MATIAENLERIQTAKSDLKTAIEAKGVTVPSSATIDTYDDYVSQISGGGGQAEQDLINLIEGDLTTLEIPNGTTSIRDAAFDGCGSITSITIPDSVTNIGNYAFYNCTSLTSVTIPSSVTNIGQDAFCNCFNLTSVTIPSSVTGISDNTFANCENLASINILDSVTTIGNSAFENCFSLTSVTIPSSVTMISYRAFFSCQSLESITVLAWTPPTLDFEVFFDTNECPIYVPSESVELYKAAENWNEYESRIQAIP